MRHRSPARWLAPLALFACVVAVAAVIGQSLRPDERSTAAAPGSSAQTRTISAGDGSARRGPSRRRRTYTVRAGDTLSAIAARTGVPLGRLQQLNPRLDSDSLQAGQRIKLSP
jgi:LysM repeat protein